MEPKREHIEHNAETDGEGSDDGGIHVPYPSEKEISFRTMRALEKIASNLELLRKNYVKPPRKLGELLGEAIRPPRM